MNDFDLTYSTNLEKFSVLILKELRFIRTDVKEEVRRLCDEIKRIQFAFAKEGVTIPEQEMFGHHENLIVPQSNTSEERQCKLNDPEDHVEFSKNRPALSISNCFTCICENESEFSKTCEQSKPSSRLNRLMGRNELGREKLFSQDSCDIPETDLRVVLPTTPSSDSNKNPLIQDGDRNDDDYGDVDSSAANENDFALSRARIHKEDTPERIQENNPEKKAVLLCDNDDDDDNSTDISAPGQKHFSDVNTPTLIASATTANENDDPYAFSDNSVEMNDKDRIKHKHDLFKAIDSPVVSDGHSINLKAYVRKENFLCKLCSKSFCVYSNYKQHLKTHFAKKTVASNLLESNFTSESSLKLHGQCQEDESNFCKYCDISKVYNKGDLEAHKRYHTAKNVYTCNICSKTFYRMQSLNAHIHMHTGEKPYSCTHCGKHFATSSRLKTHMKTHSDERPFTCHVCEKKFKALSSLTTHIRSHIGKKPFTCKLCCRGFAFARGLTDHMRVHTAEKPFTCKICCKSFSAKRTLTTHIRNHTGEKPYACKICHKTFATKGYLNNHILAHTGEKQYVCDFCGKRFSCKMNWSNHMVIHTGQGRINAVYAIRLILLA